MQRADDFRLLLQEALVLALALGPAFVALLGRQGQELLEIGDLGLQGGVLAAQHFDFFRGIAQHFFGPRTGLQHHRWRLKGWPIPRGIGGRIGLRHLLLRLVQAPRRSVCGRNGDVRGAVKNSRLEYSSGLGG